MIVIKSFCTSFCLCRICDVTFWHARNELCRCVPWIIHTCDMTWLIHVQSPFIWKKMKMKHDKENFVVNSIPCVWICSSQLYMRTAHTYTHIYTHIHTHTNAQVPEKRYLIRAPSSHVSFIIYVHTLTNIYIRTCSVMFFFPFPGWGGLAAMRLLHIPTYMLLCDSYTYLHTHTYIHSGYVRRRHMKVSLYMYIHWQIYIYARAYVHAGCMHKVQVSTCVCACVRTCTCACVRTRACVCVCMYASACVCVCVCVCVYL